MVVLRAVSVAFMRLRMDAKYDNWRRVFLAI